MAVGINIQLHNGTTPLANLTGIKAVWWDSTDPTSTAYIGSTSNATTNASGYCILDLTSVSSLSVGDTGFLQLYKLDAVDHRDSLIFAGQVTVETVTSGVSLDFNSGWQRPGDWLSMPTVTNADQKFVGLYAVFDNDSNFVAFTATGNYTVDWGDGSATENVNSGVTAQHQYTYSSINSTTECSRGYRQVLVTVTPQSGQSLNSVDLGKRHSGASAQVYTTGWLDVICSCNPSSVGGLSFASSSSLLVAARRLERCKMLNGSNRTNFDYALAGTSVKDIYFESMASATSLAYLFYSTTTGKLPPIVAPNCNSIAGMFRVCPSEIPSLTLSGSSGINITNAYQSSGTSKIPVVSLSGVTSIVSLANGANNLNTFPAINFAGVTTLTTPFTGCVSLARSLATGIAVDHSYANCNLGGPAINEILDNLPTVVGKTVTFTGNYGVTDPIVDTTKGTSKGWTVVL